MQGTAVAIPARDLGEALRASLASAVNTFLSAIPRLLGFAIILAAGWVVSSLLAKGVAVLLHAMNFNELARRSGFAELVQRMGVRADSAGVIAGLTKWFVRVFALVVAVSQLGIPTTLINTLLAGVVGALALATGLAFGLGGRDYAARLLERLGPPAQSAAPRIARPTGTRRGETPPATPPAVPPRDLEEPDEAQFVPRSGFDRRRIARPGSDRRAAGHSAA